MSLRLRAAERRDVPAMIEIEVERFPEPWTRGMILDELGQPESRYYVVAERDGRVEGYAGIMVILDEVHVNTIGVRASAEGRGLGRALLSEVLAEGYRRGARRATLEVAVSNERARELYQRFGFAPVGVRRRYYERTGEDALVMWAELDGPPGEAPTLA